MGNDAANENDSSKHAASDSWVSYCPFWDLGFVLSPHGLCFLRQVPYGLLGRYQSEEEKGRAEKPPVLVQHGSSTLGLCFILAAPC